MTNAELQAQINELRADVQRLYELVASGPVRLVSGGGATGGVLTPPTLGAAAEGDETADSTTWDRAAQSGNQGLQIWDGMDMVYDHGGNKILYKFARMLTFDSLGCLQLVSGETRSSVDVTEAC